MFSDSSDKAERQGPETVKEILGRLFVAKGWGRKQGRLRLEKAWMDSSPEKYHKYTRVLSIRKGILQIEVCNSMVMQELAGFHKRKILLQLQKEVPEKRITDIRFRSGSWDTDG